MIVSRPTTQTRRTLLTQAGLCSFATVGAILSPQARAKSELVLRLPDPREYEPAALASFYTDALLLALSKTAVGEETVNFSFAPKGIVRERLRLMLRQGELDLMWSSSTPQREAAFEPVRFNLLKGINEHRFLLTRAQDQQKFSHIQSLPELKAFEAGAGEHWSDAAILRANGFRVVTSSTHGGLFKMLAAKRFDFIPRAITEISADLVQHGQLDLAMSEGPALQYRQPIYFFVSKGNTELAERIRRGLEMAQADGSFDKLFFSVPTFKSGWDYLRRSKARFFKLETELS